MPSLRDCHIAVVKELQARGEAIYNPCAKSMLSHERDVPKVYVKGRQFRTPEFVCGSAIMEKDGSVSILPEAMADLIGIRGFKIEDLGLCDPVLFYANNDERTYPLKAEADNILRTEAYTALSGQLPPRTYVVVLRAEYYELEEILRAAWRDGKKLQVTVQEVPA